MGKRQSSPMDYPRKYKVHKSKNKSSRLGWEPQDENQNREEVRLWGSGTVFPGHVSMR